MNHTAITRRLRTAKPTTMPIATAPPELNPFECEDPVFVVILSVPSLVGLAVGFSVGKEGRDPVGAPPAVLLFGGLGKEAGGEEAEGAEGGFDGNVDGGGTSAEGGGGALAGGGTSAEGGDLETLGGDACEGGEGELSGGFPRGEGGEGLVGGLGTLAGGGGDGEIG